MVYCSNVSVLHLITSHHVVTRFSFIILKQTNVIHAISAGSGIPPNHEWLLPSTPSNRICLDSNMPQPAGAGIAKNQPLSQLMFQALQFLHQLSKVVGQD